MRKKSVKRIQFSIFRLGKFLVLSVLYLPTLTQWGNAGGLSALKEPATIKSGDRQIVLPVGTVLSILKKDNAFCVVSIPLPDGTSIITQISPTSISTTEGASNSGRPSSDQTGPGRNLATRQEFRSPSVIKAAPQLDNSVDVPAYPKFEVPSNSPDLTLPGIRYTIKMGTFPLLINNTLATVVYAIPMDGANVAESASNLVFYGPYPNEKTKLNGNIVPSIVTNLGCTVFSFQIDGIGQSVSDKPYWDKEAGWFEAALRARDILVKKFAFPLRKLILIGYSGGGGMVMNFAGAYPDEIEAVAAQAPDVVPAYPRGNTVKWLMVVNRGDPNRSVMAPFYDQLKSDKCQALFCETTPDRTRGHYHSPSGETFSLIYSFIAGILDQRELTNEGITDEAHLWPYVAPSSPLQRYAIVKTSDLQPEDLQNGHYNFLPSLAFTVNWSRVCPPEQIIRSGNGHTRLTLNIPARPVPVGVIFYYDNPSYADIPREVEDINSLAEHGYLVISTMTANPDEFVSAASAWVKSQDSLRGVHLHLIGNGAPGARFISKVAERNDISFKSVSVIDFGDTWLQADCQDEVISAAKECGMYGFFSYSDSEEETILYRWADALVDQGARNRGCFNFCATATDPPKDSEAVRHNDAENEALGMVKSLISRADSP